MQADSELRIRTRKLDAATSEVSRLQKQHAQSSNEILRGLEDKSAQEDVIVNLTGRLERQAQETAREHERCEEIAHQYQQHRNRSASIEDLLEEQIHEIAREHTRGEEARQQVLELEQALAQVQSEIDAAYAARDRSIHDCARSQKALQEFVQRHLKVTSYKNR